MSHALRYRTNRRSVASNTMTVPHALQKPTNVVRCCSQICTPAVHLAPVWAVSTNHMSPDPTACSFRAFAGLGSACRQRQGTPAEPIPSERLQSYNTPHPTVERELLLRFTSSKSHIHIHIHNGTKLGQTHPLHCDRRPRTAGSTHSSFPRL